jgi:hypothetical protein
MGDHHSDADLDRAQTTRFTSWPSDLWKYRIDSRIHQRTVCGKTQAMSGSLGEDEARTVEDEMLALALGIDHTAASPFQKHVKRNLLDWRDRLLFQRARLRSQREEIGKVRDEMRAVRPVGYATQWYAAWPSQWKSWLAALDAILRQE